MKKITRMRLKNKYLFLSIATLFFVLAATWFVESNCAEILFMDYDSPELVGRDKEEVFRILMGSILTWEVYIDSAMRYVMHIFPLFAVIPTVLFLFERKSYFDIGANRFQNRTKEIVKTVLLYSLQGGLAISLAFWVFFIIGSFFVIPTIQDIGGFASVFPKGFYAEHPFIFFTFLAFTMYFAIGFLFAMMACGIALLTEKEFFVVTLPVLIYIVLSYIGGGFDIFLLQVSSCVGAFNTLHSTFECFLPLLPVLALDAVFLLLGVKKRNAIIS